MSTKKSKPLPAPKYSQSDFKKVAPDALEKLGYSRKSERYKAPAKLKKDPEFSKYIAKDGTISKGKYIQAIWRKSAEQKRQDIASGKQKIATNAPKAARAAKIEKSFEKQSGKGKVSAGHITPNNLKNFKQRKTMRYDYFLGHSIDAIAEHKILLIIQNHPPNSKTRIVAVRTDIINAKNKEIGDGRSSDLFFLKSAIKQVPNFIEQLESRYSFLKHGNKTAKDFLPVQYWLYVYIDY